MATYTTTYPGNLALQTEVWTLTLDEAKSVQTQLNCHRGGYWDTNLVKPTRRAQRAKAATVRIYTAGFTSGEFSNALYASGSTIN
jgi:hypothetical protein